MEEARISSYLSTGGGLESGRIEEGGLLGEERVAGGVGGVLVELLGRRELEGEAVGPFRCAVEEKAALEWWSRTGGGLSTSASICFFRFLNILSRLK